MVDRAQFLDANYEHFLKWIAQLENDIAEQKRRNQETQARQLLAEAQERLVQQASVTQVEPEPEPVAPKASKRQKTKK